MQRRKPLKSWNKIDKNGFSYLVPMCIVCIANNLNQNVYMYLNTRIFLTTGYARVLLFMFIRWELRGTGTVCLFQFTHCDLDVTTKCNSRINQISILYANPWIFTSFREDFLICFVINCHLGGHLVRILILFFIWLQDKCLQSDFNFIANN